MAQTTFEYSYRDTHSANKNQNTKQIELFSTPKNSSIKKIVKSEAMGTTENNNSFICAHIKNLIGFI